MAERNARFISRPSEPSGPDFEVKGDVDVIAALLKGHTDLDNERFDKLGAMISKVEKKIDLATMGVLAAVGAAVLNLVIKHT